MKFLTTFKIFEARLLPEPMYAVWLLSGDKSLGGVFPHSLAKELYNMLEVKLDPDSDDLVSISDDPIIPPKGESLFRSNPGIIFDGSEGLNIYSDHGIKDEIPDYCDWASTKDLFSHPGEFLDLRTAYSKNKDKKWYSMVDGLYQAYGEELQLPSIEWSKPEDSQTEGE